MKPEESEFFYGQLISMDIDLAPGESMTGEVHSIAGGWSTMNHAWIKFDSVEERGEFFGSEVLSSLPGDYNAYEIDMGDAGIRWMRDTFGIEIKSGKH